MYELIQISKINDFIFCPYSIYLHSIYDSFTQDAYHRKPQKRGKIKHEPIDKRTYSTSKDILQGIPLYSEKYHLIGKLDVFETKTGKLIERKSKIKQIFDGYKYQLYAEMLCLEEVGYKVKSLFIHSLIDNKRYQVSLPNEMEMENFKRILQKMWELKDPKPPSDVSPEKCKNCIYSQLCDHNDANFA